MAKSVLETRGCGVDGVDLKLIEILVEVLTTVGQVRSDSWNHLMNVYSFKC